MAVAVLAEVQSLEMKVQKFGLGEGQEDFAAFPAVVQAGVTERMVQTFGLENYRGDPVMVPAVVQAIASETTV